MGSLILFTDTVPDETTILNFRHLLEEHDLQEAIFAAINGDLEERGLLMKRGTLVDATIIAAPSSTKNKSRKRDPEMSSTKKGNQYYFGMKAHIGVDSDSSLVHSLIGTEAKRHDSTQRKELLHGEEQVVGATKVTLTTSTRKSVVLIMLSTRFVIKESAIPLCRTAKKSVTANCLAGAPRLSIHFRSLSASGGSERCVIGG